MNENIYPYWRITQIVSVNNTGFILLLDWYKKEQKCINTYFSKIKFNGFVVIRKKKIRKGIKIMDSIHSFFIHIGESNIIMK